MSGASHRQALLGLMASIGAIHDDAPAQKVHMKIVVIGGTGLIGSKLVTKLLHAGHVTVPASPASGVNTVTGAGLPKVLVGADVVVDTSNAPSFEEKAGFSAQGESIRLPPVLVQPMSADDVAARLAVVALGAPLNGILEVGGPKEMRIDAFVRRGLEAIKDPRKVVADPQATYFGIRVTERTLVPESDSRRANTTFEQWLATKAA
jgi:uncharacterized protein YbjT (DUF2867 family)